MFKYYSIKKEVLCHATIFPIAACTIITNLFFPYHEFPPASVDKTKYIRIPVSLEQRKKNTHTHTHPLFAILSRQYLAMICPPWLKQWCWFFSAPSSSIQVLHLQTTPLELGFAPGPRCESLIYRST